MNGSDELHTATFHAKPSEMETWAGGGEGCIAFNSICID